MYAEEDVLGKAYDAKLVRRLLTYLRPYRGAVLVAFLLIVAGSGVDVVYPYLTKVAIDRYIRQGNFAGLHLVALAYVALLLAEFGLGYFQTLLLHRTGQQIMFDMRLELFRHLERLPHAFFDRNPVGRLMTRLTSDVDVLNELFTSGVVSVFGDLFALVGILIAIFVLNWKLALVVCSVIPLLFAAAFLFKIKVRESYREVRIFVAKINAFLQENITGMTVVQVFGREQKKFCQFDAINEGHRRVNLQSVFYHAVFYPVFSLISALALGLLLWYGGGQILAAALTLGSLVAFIQYVERFFQPINDLTEKYNILQSAMASSERIFKLLDTPVTLQGPAQGVTRPVEGHIEFRHVTFAYPEGEPVLRDISFTVQPGESVALVGATGAGKSTIIHLLNRSYDLQRGQILVDQVDVREWDLAHLRRSVGIVLQDVFLFSGSIQDNIRLWNPEIQPSQVIRAACHVNAHPFIQRLPAHYEHVLRERGASLSVGEKQLLAFARALAYDSRILVLDEATSSIDTETELLIRDALEKLLAGRTSLVIAHRLSTIQHVDRILVLHRGELKEEGTHQELLQKRGIYWRLYQLQYQEQFLRETRLGHAADLAPHLAE
ncbi:MAG: ABC transporter ATP-binding protein [Acidobacteria bacterium]|nr:ABC transporter ATP-binding protein [Acidobacteriota bacterium]